MNSTQEGKIAATFLQPFFSGKIVYTPDSVAARAVVAKVYMLCLLDSVTMRRQPLIATQILIDKLLLFQISDFFQQPENIGQFISSWQDVISVLGNMSADLNAIMEVTHCFVLVALFYSHLITCR